jgi:hypothetical protein
MARIEIVDDSKFLTDILKDTLEIGGHEVCVTCANKNPKLTLKKFEEKAEKGELEGKVIICDGLGVKDDNSFEREYQEMYWHDVYAIAKQKNLKFCLYSNTASIVNEVNESLECDFPGFIKGKEEENLYAYLKSLD